MPVYRYRCAEGHEFEMKAGYDDAIVFCIMPVTVPGAEYYCLTEQPTCQLPAKRQAVYRDQAVIFSGPGWTRSVVPPPEPLPPSSAGESTDVHFEKLDEFAEKQYKYDKEVRPEVKKRGTKAAD